MSDLDQTQVLPPPAPPEQGQDEAVSILSGLRREHSETRQSRTKWFVIPGYEDRPTPLACRYGVIPWAEQMTLENRAGDDDMADPLDALFIPQLVLACREFGVIADDAFQPLSKSKPVRWGSDQLVEGLGLQVPERSATAILRAVFDAAVDDPADTEYAISAHHKAVVIKWMHGGRNEQGAAAEADEEFAKNS